MAPCLAPGEPGALSVAPDLRYPRYVLVDWHPHSHALADARAWCARHLDPTRPAESLRTLVLRPPRYPDDWMYCALDCEEVAALIDRRRSLLTAPTPPSNPGRILCVVGDLDTAMGEGTVESNGVIDDAYLPPWDTWFACVHAGDHTLLLAWIPAPLVDAVQAAIDVAATEPIAWLAGPHPLHSAWQDVRDLLADAHRVLNVLDG